MAVKYPFLNKQDKPIHNARELYAALSFSLSGFFGVGGNNFWHGGLHFSKAMAAKISLEKPVMCIGDGEVIAWRINKEYKKSTYKGMNLEYSNGFVLVRHTHKFQTDTTSSIDLDWYSLYMHLLPYSEYKSNQNLVKPFFYEEHSIFQSVADKSRDSESGRFLYTDKGKTFKEIIPPSTIVDIEETDSNNISTGSQTYIVKSGDTLYQIARRYVSGGYRDRMNLVAAIKRNNNLNSDFITPGQKLEIPSTTDELSAGNTSEYIQVNYIDLFSQKQTGYIKPQRSDQIKGKQIIIDTKAGETKPERGIRMRQTGSSRANILVVLPHGTKFQVITEKGGSTKWGKVVAIMSDKGDYNGEYGYVYLPETKLIADSEPIYDKVVVPDKPVNIGAGTGVGYIGKYETPNSPNGNEQVHLEVFSGDDVEGFLSQSRAAGQGEDVKKSIIKLAEGTSLYGLSNTPADDVIDPMLGMKITPYNKQSDFVEVQITGYYGIVKRSAMATYSNGGYTVNRSQISTIQQALNSTKYAGASLEFASYVSDDKTKFSNTSQNTSGRYKYRLVFFKQSGKRVWIRKQDYNQLYSSKIDKLIKYGASSIAAWSENPLQFNEVIVEAVEYDVYTHESNLKKKEINNETWFEFEVEHPLGTNSRERGYAKHDVLESNSANDWPGFNIVKETAPDGMGFALNEESQNSRQLDIDSVTPLFREMLNHIDVDGDKTLTLDEVKNGNTRLSVREILPRLIVQHPSEWQADKGLSKWSKLAELLSSNQELLNHENERIRNLVWWDDVAGQISDFPSDPNVYHFHPVGFIDNLYVKPDCLCNRDLLVSDIREIVKELRTSERLTNMEIFSHTKSPLRKEDRSYERFAQELNAVFKKYQINTCKRRLHFLAQVYHETDRFRTTLEYGAIGSKRYDPYRGRGLIQLTWKEGYVKYGSYKGISAVSDPDIISNYLSYSVDTAGWYWNRGKSLSAGTKWKAPSGAPDYVKKYKGASYTKKSFEYSSGGKTKKYYTINFNHIADDDYTDIISYLINGGSNGLHERRKYVETLKNIFVCESESISDTDECAPWVKIAEQEIGTKEISGGKHTKQILEYHKSVKLPIIPTDEVPWCGSFIGWVMKQKGYTPPANAFRALSWAKWGVNVKQPIYGAIAVKTRKGGGHVGIVVGKKGSTHLLILGGNQADSVKISTYRKSVFSTFRYPPGVTVTQNCKKLEEGLKRHDESGKES